MKILIIEDDIRLALSFMRFLNKKGLETDCVYNSDDGIAYAKTGTYDILLIESMMPKISGCQITKALRSSHCTTPILMFNSKSDNDDELAALESGATHYLTKPLNPKKLLTCIHAIFQKHEPFPNALCVGNTVLHLLTSTLSCGEHSIHLTEKEFVIMSTFMSSPKQLFSKEVLLHKVWGTRSNAVENHVEVYIRTLRNKLSQIDSDVLIKTIRCQGYVLEHE